MRKIVSYRFSFLLTKLHNSFETRNLFGIFLTIRMKSSIILSLKNRRLFLIRYMDCYLFIIDMTKV